MKKQVRFNLKNVAYAPLTETIENGVSVYSWGTPKKVPGAVTLDLNSSMSMTPFHADGMIYYMAESDQGYTGSLTMARYPDEMLKDIWGIEEDEVSHVLIENVNAKTKPFALLYQIDLNDDNEFYVLYNVMGTKPNIGSTTNTETKTPQTQASSIAAYPLENGTVMARTGARTPSSVKNAWYTSVFQRTAQEVNLASMTIGTSALVPTFDASVVTYAVTVSTASSVITAAAVNPGATVAIKNGDTVVTNGGSATWVSGENTLTVTVTSGEVSKVYTVTVTYNG